MSCGTDSSSPERTDARHTPGPFRLRVLRVLVDGAWPVKPSSAASSQ